MQRKITLFLTLFLAAVLQARAQKPFAEGVIVYKVRLESEDHKVLTGVYTYTFKDNHVRKELALENGFQDIVVMDCGAAKVFSLQNINGKKYAIELSMDELVKRQQRYSGFTVAGEQSSNRQIAGYAVYKANIAYTDGGSAEVVYTKDWRTAPPVAFERFPNAGFLPMSFSYVDEHGITMQFEAEKVQAGPVENSVFRIPPDYKLISNAEYKELSR